MFGPKTYGSLPSRRIWLLNSYDDDPTPARRCSKRNPLSDIGSDQNEGSTTPTGSCGTDIRDEFNLHTNCRRNA
jgi:hypothetical protein